MADESKLVERLYRRARKDFAFYCTHFVKIKYKDGRVGNLTINPAQQIIVDAIVAQESAGLPVRLIGLKGRQQGFSTIVQAYLSWKVFLNRGKNALVIAHDLEPASQLFGKVEMIYEYFPEECGFKPPRAATRSGRKLALAAPMHGMLYVETSQNRDAGRSGTFQFVHATELPYWEDAKRTMDGLLQSVPNEPGTAIILESTAGGMGDYFHTMWLDAVNGRVPFKPVFVPWFKTPEYARPWNDADEPFAPSELAMQRKYKLTDEQVLWYRDKQSVLGVDVCKQEYPCSWEEAFLASGLPFFFQEDLEYQSKTHIRPPLRKGEFVAQHKGRVKLVDTEDGRWWIWRLPDKTSDYVVFGDTSSGRARDYTAIHVLNTTTLEVVATFRGLLTPDEAATELQRIGLVYNVATVACETNNHGELTIHNLWKVWKYPNLYVHRDEATTTGSETTQYGWRTTTKTRPLMLNALQELVHHRRLKLPCIRTLDELRTFVFTTDDGKKAEAQAGCWDDMVMSLAGACAIRGSAGGEISFDVAS